MQRLSRTWTAGGVGLIACGVIGVLRNSLPGAPSVGYLDVAADVVYASAVLLLGIGLSREASIVARQPLGVIAVGLVAVWPLIADVANWSLAALAPEGPGAAWTVLGYLSILVPVGAGLTAATRIARAGVVHAPWRWAPLWALGIHTVAWVVPQLVLTAVGAAEAQLYANLFSLISTAAFLAGTLGLGILAVVLAVGRRSASVEVFRSS
ncbi:hypothetical protein [Microbacterium murale]|uniref:Integral membrane protein n=1 Tax=Microbacterium murale TaxID=1081040 RepID=A0ABQ1RNR0_9MICO|nr:hypothetical protein [Microbacterium murale]GGD76084.1 hypothetical protein GCM10007269_18930 [Microbacterium murale]